MNEADLPSINLDELRLVPDWLRDDAPSPSQQYASYDRPIESDRFHDRRAPRPGGGGGGGRDRRDARGGPGARRDDRPRPGGGSGAPRQGGGGGRRDRDERPPMRRDPLPPPPVSAPIRVEFLPDERCMASIIKQIRSTHMAYPLFSLARMFLQEPARHFLQLAVVPGAAGPGTTLCQLGEDGPVTMDRASLESIAFDTTKDRFYKEENTQRELPKGNFTSVARERVSGTLLGPSNHHGYQPALRALYESRFSRQMSFEQFRRNIDFSNDPALIERWKEQARNVTTINTVEGDPPTVLQTVNEARNHFRQHYLEGLIHQGMSFKLHGSVARNLPEPAVMQAIREAHARELRYPAQFVQLLRQGLQNAGLHIFKHRKRIVYVAVTRPVPFSAKSGAPTENVSAILATVEEFPLCTRKKLADRMWSKTKTRAKEEVATAPPQIPEVTTEPVPVEVSVAPAADIVEQTAPPTLAEEQTAAPASAVASEAHTEAAPAMQKEETDIPVAEQAPAAEEPAPVQAAQPETEASRFRAALVRDLRFLVQAGHVIEFHNGTFDLPLTAKPKEETHKGGPRPKAVEREEDSLVGADPAVALAAEPEAVSGAAEHDQAPEDVDPVAEEPSSQEDEALQEREPATPEPGQAPEDVVAEAPEETDVATMQAEQPMASELAPPSAEGAVVTENQLPLADNKTDAATEEPKP